MPEFEATVNITVDDFLQECSIYQRTLIKERLSINNPDELFAVKSLEDQLKVDILLDLFNNKSLIEIQNLIK